MGELEIVYVHETLDDLTVQSLTNKCNIVAKFHEKLLTCPFLKIDNWGISSKTIEQWNENAVTTIESTLNTELNNVYLDFYTGLDSYESKKISHETVFCGTLCLPRFLHKNDINHYQNIRKKIVQKQIEDWRIVEFKSNQIYCYKANCMTCIHQFHHDTGSNSFQYVS
jgi:hypothetical protein